MQAIEINKLTKYYGKARGIIGIDLSVDEGEIFGFIGPNGAGKSTTIRTLLNLIFPTSGQAKVFGMDIVEDTKKIKQQIGYVPAEAIFYEEMTVKEIMQYSARFYKAKLNGWYDHMIEALDLDTTRKIVDLSMGNKKKVSLIQAMLHKPKLLILDEPTAGLDPLMQQTFFDLVNEMNKEGSTVFFSSHILQEVEKMCKRVAIIKEGRIINIEDMEGLRSRHLTKVAVTAEKDLPFTEGKEGVINLDKKLNVTRFLYSGEVNGLIKQLSNVQLKKVVIEEPTLEEIFMHYYTEEGGQE